jgi:asparagine synthase (glutamine-hydrolysing)
MCGFAGSYGYGGSAAELEAAALKMADEIARRGPDDRQVWADPNARIALGFRRLAIIDLSPEGRQPMHSERFVTVFNGEIYNFRELRDELAGRGHAFRGHSDTEVMLGAVAEWGVERALQRLVGMFAVALWDKRERTLHLARDRMGEKPLYYGWSNGVLLFGSELDALRAHPAFNAEVDRDALRGYARFGYVPGPQAIWKGFRKLLPGHMLTVSDRGRGEPVPYWRLRDAIATPVRVDASEARAEVERLLLQSVKGCMVADVPLGAFLSGGTDSSLIVALMQAQSTRPVRTFTIGFHDKGYDEAPHARRVAAHLGTEHTELYVAGEDALAVVPKLARMYDEPFADSSQIPTSLVAQLARGHVTVSLSGDGGDELFGGYGRYALAQRLWGHLRRAPLGMRLGLARLIRSPRPEHWDTALPRIAVPGLQGRLTGDRIHKLAGKLGARSAGEFYAGLVTTWDDPGRVVRGGTDQPTGFDDPRRQVALDDVFDGYMYTDTLTYLPDDILVKVDRATMAVSLEGRAPLLDHRLADYLWSLPHEVRVRGLRDKRWLKEILYKYVPRGLIERPKMGFGIPLDQWLRGPLRPWAEELLDARRLDDEGYLVSGEIRKRWGEHQRGARNWQASLWNVLMFQTWLDART